MSRTITINRMGRKLYFAGYEASGQPKLHPLKKHAVRFLDAITARGALNCLVKYFETKTIKLETN